MGVVASHLTMLHAKRRCVIQGYSEKGVAVVSVSSPLISLNSNHLNTVGVISAFALPTVGCTVSIVIVMSNSIQCFSLPYTTAAQSLTLNHTIMVVDYAPRTTRGVLIAAATNTGDIYFVDALGWKVVYTFHIDASHTDVTCSIDSSTQKITSLGIVMDNLLVVGTSHCRVYMFYIDSGQFLRHINCCEYWVPCHILPISAISFDSENELLLVGCAGRLELQTSTQTGETFLAKLSLPILLVPLLLDARPTVIDIPHAAVLYTKLIKKTSKTYFLLTCSITQCSLSMIGDPNLHCDQATLSPHSHLIDFKRDLVIFHDAAPPGPCVGATYHVDNSTLLLLFQNGYIVRLLVDLTTSDTKLPFRTNMVLKLHATVSREDLTSTREPLPDTSLFRYLTVEDETRSIVAGTHGGEIYLLHDLIALSQETHLLEEKTSPSCYVNKQLCNNSTLTDYSRDDNGFQPSLYFSKKVFKL